MIETPKKPKGKQITVTLSPYVLNQLITLAEKKHLSRSSIITIALEKLTKEVEREEEIKPKNKK